MLIFAHSNCFHGKQTINSLKYLKSKKPQTENKLTVVSDGIESAWHLRR